MAWLHADKPGWELHLNLQVAASLMKLLPGKARPWEPGAATLITVASFMHVTNQSPLPLTLTPVDSGGPNRPQQVQPPVRPCAAACLYTIPAFVVRVSNIQIKWMRAFIVEQESCPMLSDAAASVHPWLLLHSGSTLCRRQGDPQVPPGSSLQLLHVWKARAAPSDSTAPEAAAGQPGYSISISSWPPGDQAAGPASGRPAAASAQSSMPAPASPWQPEALGPAAVVQLLLPGQCQLPVGAATPQGGPPVRLLAQQGGMGWHIVAQDAAPSVFLHNHSGSAVQVPSLRCVEQEGPQAACPQDS